jgi:hypothetical protein
MSDEKIRSGDTTRTDEEDLTKGPTPETRDADGEPAKDADTSDGPTPETREAERRS